MIRIAFLCSLVIAAAGLVACSHDDPVEPVPTPKEWTADDLVATTGWFPTIHPDSNAISVARHDSLDGGGGRLSCTVWEGEQVRALERLTVLAAPNSPIHAGALLQWASLTDPVPLPVVAERAGGELRLITPGGIDAPGVVTAVTADSVAAWRRRTLSAQGEVTVGPWTLSAGIVYAPEQLAVVAGLVPSAFTGEVGTSLAFDEEATGRVLVRLQRTHHTVVCPYPGSAAAAFAADVDLDDLAGQMGVGNPPVWVERVDHGQCLLVLVEANVPPETVAAAALNAFAAGATAGTPDPELPSLEDLPDLRVKVFALGADADAAAVAFSSGQASLADFLQTPVAEPGALPAVTAALLALRNGGPLRQQAAAVFDLETCEEHEPVFDDVLWSFHAGDAHTVTESVHLATDRDGLFEYDAGIDYPATQLVVAIPDLLGDGGLAVPPYLARPPFLLTDMVGGHPAVEFYYLHMREGQLYSELTFDGSGLVGRDYTLFVVCGMPSHVRFLWVSASGASGFGGDVNHAEYFLHGTGEGVRHNLKVGWSEPELMVYSHEPYRLEFPDSPGDDWHVYAFRYGLYSGLAAFCDAELIDSDATDNFDLLEFDGATLCSRWQSPYSWELGAFWLAEITAYRGAGSDADVVAESMRLLQKYGLEP